MSLGVAFKGPEGIVLAADSRVTLTATLPNGMLLPATFDNATKMLKVKGHDYVGAVTYGQGALGQTQPRTAHSYLPEFEQEVTNGRLSVEEFATRLGAFFEKQWKAANMPAGADPMVFLVGGFDEGMAYGRVFKVEVPTAVAPAEQSPGDNFGLTWGGQLQSASRLLKGYDPGLLQIIGQFLNLDAARQADLEAHISSKLGAGIPYQFLPLQDCVDLAIFLIRTTSSLQRFVVDIRGVGGEIDVATITRTDGFRAIQQKEVRGERAEV